MTPIEKIESQKITNNKIIHYPQLDTVIMIEESIQKMDYPKKTELWKKLPKRVMYQTFCLVIDYLEKSGKILIDQDGRIVWTWNPEIIRKLKERDTRIR